MKPSTSPGVRSNVGIAKPSPAVRQTGNMRCLLVMGRVYRSSVPGGGTQVKYRCRCRDNDTSCKKSSEVLTPPHKLWEGKRARHQEGHMFHLPPSHNVVVKINLLARRDTRHLYLLAAQDVFVLRSRFHARRA